MKKEDFLKLDSITQKALIIALNIRNAMEDFHVEHLSDDQMKELNPIIRQATFDILTYLNLAQGKDIAAFSVINELILCIPDYWELPNENSPTEYLSQLKELLNQP